MTTHKALMLYTQFDDDYNNGYLKQLRQRLDMEVRAQTGQRFGIFHPDDVGWGQQTDERIATTLNEVIFLIVILTPTFFNDATYCKYLRQFLQRERTLGRNDLILPIVYINTPNQDELAQEIGKRRPIDWSNFRFESLDTPQVRKQLADMAAHISTVMQRILPTLLVAQGAGNPTSGSPSPAPNPQPPASNAQIASWQRMLDEKRENLLLIEEQMSKFVSHTAIPLDLIKSKRHTEDEIADLERKLGLR